VSLARGQAQKVDRVLTETLDRLRIQLIHADQMMTGALDTVEDAGTTVKRSVLGPVRQATAVIRGVKAGIDVLRNRQRSSDGSGESPDEGLFI
jgi:type IV secretory pathway VirB2 component (pilin)